MSLMRHGAAPAIQSAVPDVDTQLLLTHLQYALWAVTKTIAVLDKLPEHAITCSVVNSFPSICATLQHLYQSDSYYFTHMQGGKIAFGAVAVPQTYADLKIELPKLHESILQWSRDNLHARNI